MIYRFEIENFASFRDAQVIDLHFHSSAAPDPRTYAELFPGAGAYIPKVVSIFGANASGKTNILLALEFALKVAARREDAPSICFPFNSPDTFHEPTRFAIEFSGLIPDTNYFALFRYLLIVEAASRSGLSIKHESLRHKPDGRGHWQRLENFSTDWARRVALRSPLLGHAPDQLVHQILSSEPDSLLQLNRQLPRFCLGVERISYQYTPQGPQARFTNQGMKQEIPWSLESSGTRAFVRAFPFLNDALRQGSLCAMDDLDAGLHPLLVPRLLDWFYMPEAGHPGGSQLWFTTHNTSLLEGLTRDQVILCDKDEQGCSTITQLKNTKARQRDNLSRKYLAGVYGGVPFSSAPESGGESDD
ncbi:MAG: AAA family ATPase [Acidobacteria bacterium]|nr:AAA family ATPase [Acidobacteriota bacterium]